MKQDYSTFWVLFFSLILPLALCVIGVGVTEGPVKLPQCPAIRLWNVECPACGGTRATRNFYHGNFSEAWQHNQAITITWFLIVISLMIGVGATFSQHCRNLVKTLLSGLHYHYLWFIIPGILLWVIQGIVKINNRLP